MERTKSDVIAALATQEITMTKRRLTDWIQKRWLPPLTEQRDGHGRFARYVWTQPRIAEQVATLEELLGLGCRAPAIYGFLWLLGHDVPTPAAINALRTPIAQAWSLWGRGATSLEDVEDNISRYAVRLSRRRRGRPARYPGFAEAAARYEAVFNLLANPRFDATIAVLEQVLDMGPSRCNAGMTDESARAMRQWIQFAQRVLVVPRLYQAMETAPEHDFEQARADLLHIGQAVGYLRNVLLSAADDDMRRLLESRLILFGFLGAYGPWLIAADVALRRAGHGRVIERSLRWFSRKMWQLTQDPEAREQLISAMHQHAPDVSALDAFGNKSSHSVDRRRKRERRS